HPWLIIARLWLGGDSTDFDKAKTKFSHIRNIFRILVEACGQPHRILEFQSKNFSFQPRIIMAVNRFDDGFGAPNLQKGVEASRHRMVSFLGMQREKYRFDKFVHVVSKSTKVRSKKGKLKVRKGKQGNNLKRR